ncbi:hypothetical protein J6590_086602 [Homalodisca vitripennis]|nr:hypothetical protein J6590_086602 [Homalodisca vitripennis]
MPGIWAAYPARILQTFRGSTDVHVDDTWFIGFRLALLHRHITNGGEKGNQINALTPMNHRSLNHIDLQSDPGTMPTGSKGIDSWNLEPKPMKRKIHKRSVTSVAVSDFRHCTMREVKWRLTQYLC